MKSKTPTSKIPWTKDDIQFAFFMGALVITTLGGMWAEILEKRNENNADSTSSFTKPIIKKDTLKLTQ